MRVARRVAVARRQTSEVRMQADVGGSMSKVRVYEVAKQLNLDPKAVVALFQAIGVTDVRNHMSSVEPEAVERVKRHLEKQKTHDVVEERVRTDGRVVKRRAVAKARSRRCRARAVERLGSAESRSRRAGARARRVAASRARRRRSSRRSAPASVRESPSTGRNGRTRRARAAVAHAEDDVRSALRPSSTSSRRVDERA